MEILEQTERGINCKGEMNVKQRQNAIFAY